MLGKVISEDPSSKMSIINLTEDSKTGSDHRNIVEDLHKLLS